MAGVRASVRPLHVVDSENAVEHDGAGTALVNALLGQGSLVCLEGNRITNVEVVIAHASTESTSQMTPKMGNPLDTRGLEATSLSGCVSAAATEALIEPLLSSRWAFTDTNSMVSHHNPMTCAGSLY